VIGSDYCAGCERRTAFALAGRRADPAELVGTDFEGEAETAVVEWRCLTCGARKPASLQRLVVHFAALGLDPRPARRPA
jgi:hypothetical protein